MKSVLNILVVAVLFTALSDAAASAEFSRLTIGFDSVGRVGCWLPVSAAADGLAPNDSVELHITTSDPRGNPVVEVADAAVAGSDGTVRLTGHVRFGRLEGTASVAVVSADDPATVFCRTSVAHGESLVPPDDANPVQSVLQLWQYDVPFLLTVGTPAGIEEVERNAQAVTRTNPPVEPPLVILRVDSVADLPSSPLGYDGIDHVLLNDRFSLSADQFHALKLWILSGGHWVVASGKTLPALLETLPGQWLQSRFEISDEPVPVRILSALETYVSGASRVPTFYESVPMAVPQTEQARVLARAVEGPLVSRIGAGAGVVTFVSIELNSRPMSTWRSLPQLYETMILGHSITGAAGSDARTARISSSGVSDLATQLMASVDVQPAAGRWSTWSVMAIVFGYLLLIGPIDYLLVVVVLKRPHLTWISFPLLVIAGVCGLMALKPASEDDAARLRQLNVVDVMQDHDEQRVFVRTWMSLSSPDTRRSDFSTAPAAIAPLLKPQTVERSLSWAGRPEDVYGGLYRVGGVGLGRQQYTHIDDAGNSRLNSVPLMTDGSFDVLSSWTAESTAPLIDSKLAVSGLGLLEGTVSHSLPEKIDDWIIVHGNRLYRSTGRSADGNSLAPGTALDLQRSDIRAADLKSFLNGTRLVRNTGSQRGSVAPLTTQIITPYNPLGRDPMDIVTMISLFEIAGGQSYVGLTQHQLRRLELSDSIRLNYALLLGRYSQPATELLQDGTAVPPADSETLVRLLIPVNRQPARRQGMTAEEMNELENSPEGVIEP
ncbi:MAG: hypothetical protein R3C19_07510 [Planctomycetaceae bacterium]